MRDTVRRHTKSPMSVTVRTRVLISAAAVVAAGVALGDDTFSGYLCCNMRTDGSWISDINYDESGKTMIPDASPHGIDREVLAARFYAVVGRRTVDPRSVDAELDCAAPRKQAADTDFCV